MVTFGQLINKAYSLLQEVCVYQLLQIRIYVSVLQNGWVTLGQLSIRASKRGVYQFLQIQISVSVLQNRWMTLGQLSI